MPDFEALIRHQQLKQKGSDKRLKLINSSDSSKYKVSNELNTKHPKVTNYFLAGFSGSLIATLTLLFLYENNLLSLDLITINKLIHNIS